MLDCLIKVIGVIGADVTTLVSTIFATTNVSISEQSIVSALVGTSGALFGAVFSALVAALISGSPLVFHCSWQGWAVMPLGIWLLIGVN